MEFCLSHLPRATQRGIRFTTHARDKLFANSRGDAPPAISHRAQAPHSTRHDAAIVLALRPMAFPPAIAAAYVSPTEFSTERARSDLTRITTTPTVMGSPKLDHAPTYLAGPLRAGLEAEITSNTIVRQSRPHGDAAIAESSIVVARLPGTASSGAILVGGHLDSVHTTTAASDCGGGSVGVLEVARALVAGPPLRNDVIFLIEDGEETTRTGALTFVEAHPWAQDVRVALNQEAMGVEGGSQLHM